MASALTWLLWGSFGLCFATGLAGLLVLACWAWERALSYYLRTRDLTKYFLGFVAARSRAEKERGDR